MEVSQNTSISKRFSTSLFLNFFRSGLTFLTTLLLARWLGPEDFGRMAFLIASFLALLQFTDMASSQAFFTFLSQRKRSPRFIGFYWCWVGFQLFFSLLIVGLILPDSLTNIVWKGESKSIILLALVAIFMQQTVWSSAFQMAEARRETIKVQKLYLGVTLGNFVIVIFLWMGGQLFLPYLFVLFAIEWSIAGWLAARMYYVEKFPNGHTESINETPGSVILEFWKYCKPLVPIAFLGFIHDFADRWMLQNWGGSSEQAYYGLAFQFAAVALLATISILKIFWKEIAEAYHQGDKDKFHMMYQTVSRGLFFLSAFIAGGLVPWAGELISFLIGDTFIDGKYTLMIMFLYPMFQSLGQIVSTTLLATEKTFIQAISGIIFLISSSLVAYFMLAPNNALIPGLGLESQGLAFKMVILCAIQVNAVSFVISRIFKWKFDWAFQLIGIGIALSFGWLSKILVTLVISNQFVLSILVSSFLYTLLMGFFLYLMPWVAGLNREHLTDYLTKITSIIRK